MSMFPPPKLLPSAVKVAWIREAKPSFRDPGLLHRKYWKLYNTVTIPLLSPEEFYADALAAARDSETTRELEQTLAKKCEQRREELERVFKTVRDESPLHMDDMPVCAAAFDSGNHGSLSSFARAIAGVVFGWDQTQAGDFAQDFNYLLPKNHWYRSNDPADWQGTQVDPFYDLAELVPDDDTESYGLRPDSSRVDECSDQNEGTLKYSKSTQNGNGPKQLTNPHGSQQNATDDPHSDGSGASTPPSDDSGLAQASSKKKTSLSSSKESPDSVLSPAAENLTSIQGELDAESPEGTDDDPSSNCSLSVTSSTTLQEINQPEELDAKSHGPNGSKEPFRKLSEANDDGNASPQDVEAKEEFPRTPPSPPKRSRSEVDKDEDDDRNRKRRMSSESRT